MLFEGKDFEESPLLLRRAQFEKVRALPLGLGWGQRFEADRQLREQALAMRWHLRAEIVAAFPLLIGFPGRLGIRPRGRGVRVLPATGAVRGAEWPPRPAAPATAARWASERAMVFCR
jgi:hypothetical protein